MPYVPNPIDTKAVQIPAELEQLVERLAENIHDVWARRRIDEGWTHGPNRNDERKQHPCLVPYNELPESEKEYDRQTVLQTIKAVLASGYVIHK